MTHQTKSSASIDSTQTTKSDRDSTLLDHRKHWADLFLKEFEKESDRAAVIVTASIFDDALEGLLKMHLVANSSSTDELFDGANAPFSTFSAKITIAHRLGLVSSRFARNLHLVRKIRNEFAHNIIGGSFEDTNVKSRVVELYKSQNYKTTDFKKKGATDDTRGMFMTVCLWMVWNLKSKTSVIKALEDAPLEFGFLETAAHEQEEDTK